MCPLSGHVTHMHTKSRDINDMTCHLDFFIFIFNLINYFIDKLFNLIFDRHIYFNFHQTVSIFLFSFFSTSAYLSPICPFLLPLSPISFYPHHRTPPWHHLHHPQIDRYQNNCLNPNKFDQERPHIVIKTNFERIQNSQMLSKSKTLTWTPKPLGERKVHGSKKT